MMSCASAVDRELRHRVYLWALLLKKQRTCCGLDDSEIAEEICHM